MPKKIELFKLFRNEAIPNGKAFLWEINSTKENEIEWKLYFKGNLCVSQGWSKGVHTAFLVQKVSF